MSRFLSGRTSLILEQSGSAGCGSDGVTRDHFGAGSLKVVTIEDRLKAVEGIGPGFDHLRILLSLSIFLWHSFSISYGQSYAETLPVLPVPVLLATLLPMFFGLSGFLVMGSALRTRDLQTFVTFRVLRILPALFTEIMISALVLGPLLTVTPLKRYFSDPRFFEYFGSLIGRVRFVLPGLFSHNPAPEYVNFALWTVGPEILCYVLMSVLLLTGLFASRRGMLFVTVGYLALMGLAGATFPVGPIVDVLPSKILVLAFLAGNLFFVFRDRIPYSHRLSTLSFAAAVGLIYVTLVTGREVWSYVALPGLLYPIVTLGLADLPRMPFFHRGDYSYGIYIYGFPIQQSVAHFFPEHRVWYINLILAFPVTLLFAIGSWHLVEKPILGVRKRVLRSRTVQEEGRFASKLAIFLTLAAYGAFVADASNVLPTRNVAKMVLYRFGFYKYKQNDVRPVFLR